MQTSARMILQSIRNNLGHRVSQRLRRQPVARMLEAKPVHLSRASEGRALVWRGIRTRAVQRSEAPTLEMLQQVRERLSVNSAGGLDETRSAAQPTWLDYQTSSSPTRPPLPRAPSVLSEKAPAGTTSRPPLRGTAVELQSATVTTRPQPSTTAISDVSTSDIAAEGISSSSISVNHQVDDGATAFDGTQAEASGTALARTPTVAGMQRGKPSSIERSIEFTSPRGHAATEAGMLATSPVANDIIPAIDDSVRDSFEGQRALDMESPDRESLNVEPVPRGSSSLSTASVVRSLAGNRSFVEDAKRPFEAVPNFPPLEFMDEADAQPQEHSKPGGGEAEASAPVSALSAHTERLVMRAYSPADDPEGIRTEPEVGPNKTFGSAEENSSTIQRALSALGAESRTTMVQRVPFPADESGMGFAPELHSSETHSEAIRETKGHFAGEGQPDASAVAAKTALLRAPEPSSSSQTQTRRDMRVTSPDRLGSVAHRLTHHTPSIGDKGVQRRFDTTIESQMPKAFINVPADVGWPGSKPQPADVGLNIPLTGEGMPEEQGRQLPDLATSPEGSDLVWTQTPAAMNDTRNAQATLPFVPSLGTETNMTPGRESAVVRPGASFGLAMPENMAGAISMGAELPTDLGFGSGSRSQGGASGPMKDLGLSSDALPGIPQSAGQANVPVASAPNDEPGAAGPGSTSPELDSMAREVYQILSRRLRVEHERARGWSG